MLVKLFTTVVCPTLEYGNSAWGPAFILDQKKVEKVQHTATRCIPELSDKTYDERLRILQLPSLVHRRLRGDLILLFKIVNQILIPILLMQILTLGAMNLNYSNLFQD